ncbi:TPA: DNA polymerase III subunit alpha [Clostridium perfringens]|nr:DNA polymerase III subunit alpha [Clostridium perfringens]
MNNYTVTHLHTELSNGTTNIDSVTKYEQYISRAKELNMKSLAFTEHGNIFSWQKKMLTCEENGIKYIHGVEAYLTETLDEKVRDNYHCCLYALNTKGMKELNKLVSNSHKRDDNHFFYTPRILIDDVIKTSDNIALTTACLGGVLNKGNENIKNKYIKFLQENKHRCFLEIQHHNVDSQKKYNKYLYDLHKKTGIRLIVGTDTHALNKDHLEGRHILQISKKIFFGDEEGWDLSFKSYEELLELYRLNHTYIPLDVIKEALENTNVLADMVDAYELDYNPKYPKLYEDSINVFKEKVKAGVKKRGIDKYPNYEEYRQRVNEEFRVYKQLGAIDYMLLQTKILEDAQKEGIQWGYGRGSVNGSIIAYLLGITECDSVKFNLNFFRFLNPHRASMADIDIDYSKEDREWIKNYLFRMKGIYAADIITFNTIADKGAIRDVGRALKMPLSEVDYIAKNFETNEEELREKYPELFKYVDIVKGTVVSVGTHPSGTIVSPISLDEFIGTCTLATTDKPVSMVQMKEVDKFGLVKLDVLGLDNIGVINKTCKSVGIDRLSPDTIDFNDDKVYDSILEDTTTIFQMESNTALDYLRRILSKETFNKLKLQHPEITKFDILKFTNGAIRPSGESFRDLAAQGVCGENGLKELDDMLFESLGYCLVQEQIMMFLVKFCGYSMAESDLVRRAIAKKGGTEQYIPEIKRRFIEYSTKTYKISVKEAEKIILPFIDVIISAQNYGFSDNHNFPYTTTSYVSAYLRYYYPLEYLTECLNTWSDDEEKTNRITNYAIRRGLTIESPKFRYAKGDYFYDKSHNSIYKGIGSIKFLNKEIGDKLYQLKDCKIDSFIDLLKIIKKININSKQLETLIKIDYFQEFGNPKQLLNIVKIFDDWFGRKSIKKDKLLALGYNIDNLKPFGNETEKQLNKLDSNGIIDMLLSKEHSKTTILERLQYEHECLGYCHSKYPQHSDKALVLDIDTKYSPKITIYKLDGEEIVYKILKRSFNTNPFKIGDMLQLGKTGQKQKQRRIGVDENGKGIYEPIEGSYDEWLYGWKKLN